MRPSRQRMLLPGPLPCAPEWLRAPAAAGTRPLLNSEAGSTLARGVEKMRHSRLCNPCTPAASRPNQPPLLVKRALLLGEEAEQRQYVSAVVAGAIEGFLGVLERRAGGVHAFAELATPTGAVCARAELFQPAPSNQASCISLFVFPCQPWPALLWPTCTDVARLLAAPLATRGRWRYARARRRTWSML